MRLEIKNRARFSTEWPKVGRPPVLAIVECGFSTILQHICVEFTSLNLYKKCSADTVGSEQRLENPSLGKEKRRKRLFLEICGACR